MAFLAQTAAKVGKITPTLVRQGSGGSLHTPTLVRQGSGGSLLKPLTTSKMSTTSVEEKNEHDIKKSVFISQSNDVFTNMALEDWIYKNLDFTNHHVMLLWRNNPCVVIGRNQNPWNETNSTYLEKNEIDLARRNSGGGTVFHDKGNVNVTFFAPNDRYNRKNNLVLLARTLEREWNLHPEINKKEDIIIDGNYKISGTASKIGRPNTYHHCTLLVDVDKDKLGSSLRRNDGLIIFDSKATASAPSPTVNLSDLHSGITVQNLMTTVGWQYLRTTPITHKDAGWDYVQRQNGFQLVNPTDEWFPGIEKIKNDFLSWEWKFGRTPKFQVGKEYDIGSGHVRVDLSVENGIVGDVLMTLPEGVTWGNFSGQVPLVSSAKGQRFTPAVFSLVEQAIRQQQLNFVQEPSRQAARA